MYASEKATQKCGTESFLAHEFRGTPLRVSVGLCQKRQRGPAVPGAGGRFYLASR